MESTILTAGLGAPGLALAINRLAVGAFFGISGYHKLFNRQRHAALRATLASDGIPLVRVNEWFVPAVELSGGAALVLGVYTTLAAMLLLAVCVVATCTDGLRRIPSFAPVDRADWLDDLLYLPEALYALMLAVVMLAGPGWLALM